MKLPTLATVLDALTPAQRASLLRINRHLAKELTRAERRGGIHTGTARREGDRVLLEVAGLRLDCTPNARRHAQETARHRANERAQVSAALGAVTPPPGPWSVVLTRVGPKVLDDDNAAASLKGPRDAIAAWLGVDDGPRAPVTWTVRQELGPYALRAEITTAPTSTRNP